MIDDVNAKVGSNNEGKEQVIAKHGIGIANANGGLLMEFSAINNLIIDGILFQHKDIHATR